MALFELLNLHHYTDSIKLDFKNGRIVCTVLYLSGVLIVEVLSKGASVQFFVYLLCYITGMLAVYLGLFERLVRLERKEFSNAVKYICAMGLVGAFFARQFVLRTSCNDCLLAIVIVYCLVRIMKDMRENSPVRTLLMIIGRYSLYIWLVHTFFAYYLFQKITFAPKISMLVFAWCVILSTATGFLLEKAYLRIKAILDL